MCPCGSLVNRKFYPFDVVPCSSYGISLNADRSRCQGLAFLRMADDRIERQFSQHLPFGPVSMLCLHMSREEFVGMSLEVVGRGMNLDIDVCHPLHTACSDVPWHNDPQRETVQEWQGLAIHLIGQQRPCTHGFLDGNRTSEAKLLTPS